MKWIDDLVNSAAADGASAPVAALAADGHDDLQELFHAWSVERQARLEAELLLEQAYRLLKRIRTDNQLSVTSRRRARSWLRRVRLSSDRDQSDDA